MEVKINKEIREYTESMFFGLSLRQFIFSLLGIIVAVGVYFLFKDTLGTEIVSWVCILAAAPFAAIGFITYHGMTAEKLIFAWLKSEVIFPKEYENIPDDVYLEYLKQKKENRIWRKKFENKIIQKTILIVWSYCAFRPLRTKLFSLEKIGEKRHTKRPERNGYKDAKNSTKNDKTR